jgi:hypothetical protein
MSAKDHDYLYAKLSHFVQFGAYCFRDFFKNYKCPVIGSFERLYKSPSNIWQPIFKYNEKNIDKVRKDFLYQLRVNIGNIGDQYPSDPDEQKYGIIDIEQSDNGPLYAAHTVAKSLYEITSEEERAYAGTGFKSFTQPLTENILPPPSDMIKPSLKEILFEIANYVENRNISRDF